MHLMPHSHQQPITAPRGRSEHDFSQPYPHWEAAVFDRAIYYAVFELRNGRRETRWKILPWAVRYAREHRDDGACLYAVAPTGRFTLLDPEKWDEWIQRWEGKIMMTRGPRAGGQKTHRGTISNWEKRSAPHGLHFCVAGDFNGKKLLTTSILRQDGSEIETLNWRYTLSNEGG
jgi:hypothetical protein